VFFSTNISFYSTNSLKLKTGVSESSLRFCAAYSFTILLDVGRTYTYFKVVENPHLK